MMTPIIHMLNLTPDWPLSALPYFPSSEPYSIWLTSVTSCNNLVGMNSNSASNGKTYVKVNATNQALLASAVLVEPCSCIYAWDLRKTIILSVCPYFHCHVRFPLLGSLMFLHRQSPVLSADIWVRMQFSTARRRVVVSAQNDQSTWCLICLSFMFIYIAYMIGISKVFQQWVNNGFPVTMFLCVSPVDITHMYDDTSLLAVFVLDCFVFGFQGTFLDWLTRFC